MGQVRIIAGKWRGRRLQVPDVKDLRPTPDRVRETLFNWLAPILPGAYCLDLFTGCGALGFEALSRGAAYVEMIDQSPEIVTLLRQELQDFGAENARIVCATVPQQMPTVPQPFDIIFLDPPYSANLLLPCCAYLEENGFLAKTAHIYLEANVAIKDNELPAHWQLLKSRRAGQVFYHLARREIK